MCYGRILIFLNGSIYLRACWPYLFARPVVGEMNPNAVFAVRLTGSPCSLLAIHLHGRCVDKENSEHEHIANGDRAHCQENGLSSLIIIV